MFRCLPVGMHRSSSEWTAGSVNEESNGRTSLLEASRLPLRQLNHIRIIIKTHCSKGIGGSDVVSS
jgi:hypothetical protein